MAFERGSTFLDDASQQNTANLAELWHHPTPKDHDFNKFENKLPKDAQGS